MSAAQIATHKHIARVRQLLGEFASEMIRRGDRHDASKFDRASQDRPDARVHFPEYGQPPRLCGEIGALR